MKILIAEDEPLIARRLEAFCRSILGQTLEGLRIAGTYEAARARLAESPVDVLLLDLNLAGEDGMNLLETFVAGSFHTIIVSAHTDQGMRAFEYGILDFVPKPCTRERLAQALHRAADAGVRATEAARYLAIRQSGRIELVAVADVLYVEGARKYSELVLADGRRKLHDKMLTRLEAVLPPGFVRIHKSYVVRLSAIARLHLHEGSRYEAELHNGVRLPVGRTHYAEIHGRLV